MVTEVKPEQPKKAISPMLVTPLPIVTEVSDEHSQKALSLMLVTLPGIVIEVSLEHPSKAPSAIAVVPFFTTKFPATNGLTATRTLLRYMTPLVQY